MSIDLSKDRYLDILYGHKYGCNIEYEDRYEDEEVLEETMEDTCSCYETFEEADVVMNYYNDKWSKLSKEVREEIFRRSRLYLEETINNDEDNVPF